MTKLAAEAWEKLQELDDETQNYLARKVLDEIESERKWDELFAKSQDVLEEMGRKALAEHLAGKTVPLDPDKL
ncbi:hypothetical protein [Candidatus Amarobacter glycogenicus]|jgi:hypothetical protein|uniref:hypothetical protein n=1 Tax=Candidatus Amarobacter glycogenicus TaxID=3140699 RepID=UPI003134DFD7|nr:hypothetical protein [Dehalococcoidia bacterium]MCC6268716.1 hypothetical protein [Dehalococcoidia bacterium]